MSVSTSIETKVLKQNQRREPALQISLRRLVLPVTAAAAISLVLLSLDWQQLLHIIAATGTASLMLRDLRHNWCWSPAGVLWSGRPLSLAVISAAMLPVAASVIRVLTGTLEGVGIEAAAGRAMLEDSLACPLEYAAAGSSLPLLSLLLHYLLPGKDKVFALCCVTLTCVVVIMDALRCLQHQSRLGLAVAAAAVAAAAALSATGFTRLPTWWLRRQLRRAVAEAKERNLQMRLRSPSLPAALADHIYRLDCAVARAAAVATPDELDRTAELRSALVSRRELAVEASAPVKDVRIEALKTSIAAVADARQRVGDSGSSLLPAEDEEEARWLLSKAEALAALRLELADAVYADASAVSSPGSPPPLKRVADVDLDALVATRTRVDFAGVSDFSARAVAAADDLIAARTRLEDLLQQLTTAVDDEEPTDAASAEVDACRLSTLLQQLRAFGRFGAHADAVSRGSQRLQRSRRVIAVVAEMETLVASRSVDEPALVRVEAAAEELRLSHEETAAFAGYALWARQQLAATAALKAAVESPDPDLLELQSLLEVAKCCAVAPALLSAARAAVLRLKTREHAIAQLLRRAAEIVDDDFDATGLRMMLSTAGRLGVPRPYIALGELKLLLTMSLARVETQRLESAIVEVRDDAVAPAVTAQVLQDAVALLLRLRKRDAAATALREAFKLEPLMLASEQLADTIGAAHRAGVAAELLMEAEALLQRVEAREAVESQLSQLLSTSAYAVEPTRLRQAVDTAAATGVADATVSRGVRLLEEVQRRLTAEGELRKLLDVRFELIFDGLAIDDAAAELTAACAAHGGEPACDSGAAALLAEAATMGERLAARRAAEKRMRTASKGLLGPESPAELLAEAIEEGRRCGVAPGLIKDCEQVLTLLRRRERASRTAAQALSELRLTMGLPFCELFQGSLAVRIEHARDAAAAAAEDLPPSDANALLSEAEELLCRVRHRDEAEATLKRVSSGLLHTLDTEALEAALAAAVQCEAAQALLDYAGDRLADARRLQLEAEDLAAGMAVLRELLAKAATQEYGGVPRDAAFAALDAVSAAVSLLASRLQIVTDSRDAQQLYTEVSKLLGLGENAADVQLVGRGRDLLRRLDERDEAEAELVEALSLDSDTLQRALEHARGCGVAGHALSRAEGALRAALAREAAEGDLRSAMRNAVTAEDDATDVRLRAAIAAAESAAVAASLLHEAREMLDSRAAARDAARAAASLARWKKELEEIERGVERRRNNFRIQPPAWQYFLEQVYEKFQPRRWPPERVEAERSGLEGIAHMTPEMLGALKRAREAYHPDKNLERHYGKEWAQIAEHLVKIINILHGYYKSKIEVARGNSTSRD